MSWHLAMQEAENTLNAPFIPSSLQLISLIKKVNPTTVCLSDPQRDLGYEMKSKLQNLLLEHYGEAFYLDPHPLNPSIVLIKHSALPSIDACHAVLTSLSCNALDSVAAYAPLPLADQAGRKPRTAKTQQAADGPPPAEALKTAHNLLAEYDFTAAGEILCGIRVSYPDEIGIVERAARALVEEMGAYQQAIDLLLAQQKLFLRDPRLRLLLARAYHLSGAFPEARAILDTMHRADLDKEALVAYADIAFRDGNLVVAFNLLQVAEETEGYAATLESLKKEVETAMHAEAEPLVGRAVSALDCGDTSQAELLARQALQLCPKNPKAREIVTRIECDRRCAEISALWEKLALVEQCDARLELLEKLLERDRDNQERIIELMTAGKSRQRRELAQARLERLRTLAKEAAWPEAFDIVWWLHDQEDQQDACREACSLSPFLSVLHQNIRIRRITEKPARQLWLEFVKALTSFQSGQPGDCLQMLEEVKHYFEKYPAFSEVYHPALTAQQERAREEIKELLRVAAQEGTSLSQAHHCFNAIRRAMVHLPTEERAQCCRIMEDRITELTPPEPQDRFIKYYKYITRSGNHEKAALIRSHISDQAALDQYDAELAEEFGIERCPVRLELSDTLQVDLQSDQPLVWMGSTDRHLLLREADDAILVVHLEKMTATRFNSPNFKNLLLCDFIPTEDTFLFRDPQNPLPRWRADLSDEKSAFTACLNVVEFCEDKDDCPVEILLSCERSTEYYAVIYDANGVKPARVVRKRLGSRSPVSDCLQLPNKTKLVVKRLSWHPDEFIIGACDIMKVCAKNLTTDYKVDEMSPRDIWAIDLANGHLYYFDRAILKRTDLEFGPTEKFLNSSCCFYFNQYRHRMGLCTTSNTLMVGVREKAALYDLVGNRISESFSKGRLIGANPARKWYIYDYCKDSRTLKLRGLGEDVFDLLEWEEAKTPPLSETNADPNWHQKLCEQIFFGYKGEEQPEEPPDGEGGLVQAEDCG